MKGTRLPDAVQGKPGPGWDAWRAGGATGKEPPPLGSYMKVTDEEGKTLWWNLRLPNGSCGIIRSHTITEHEDGTITVSPSILMTEKDHGADWHGYLERGVWRSV